MNNHPKNQHYVPQFLLRHFSIEGTDTVFCFNKQNNKEYISNIRNVASEKYFYDLEPGNTDTSFEYLLNELEGKASIIIKRILLEKSIRFLTEDDRIALSTFIGAQHIRTRAKRNDMKNLDDEIQRQFIKCGIDPNNISNYKPFQNDNEIKIASLRNFNIINSLIPTILEKKWYLSESDGRFWISDNPVVLHNEINKDIHRSTIGFSVPGIEIFMPLSPNIILCFIDNSVFEVFKNNFTENYIKYQLDNNYDLQNMVNCIKRKIPFPCTKGNIEYYNSLQLLYSEIHIFSTKNNFELARSIMKERNGVFNRSRLKIE